MTWPGVISIDSDSPSVRVDDILMAKKGSYRVAGTDGHPDLVLRFELRDGRPVCIGIVLTAKPDGRDIRTTDLGDLRIDRIADQVFGAQATPIAATTPVAGPGSRPEHRAKLEEVARIYRQHLAGNPTEAVREWFGFSERTAARRIQQARDAGLLPRTTRGKKLA
ncbi:MAG TPA: hypothetical protein VHW44_05425 [Pseudonocardiaceae bacterium]|jgi:hypothetical protein|nr:hypothetical protein [Pseudonocardiaceae bacterium]